MFPPFVLFFLVSFFADVRGHSHMPNAGAANIQGGVTIDLQKLNQVAIAADRQSVALGPGSRWVGAFRD